MKRKPYQKPTIIEIIRKAVKDVTGIDPYCEAEYRGTEFVKARQLFMYFIRKYANYSQFATARLLGKDHSTVVHAERSVDKYRAIESDYCEMFDMIEMKIKTRKSK
jgi:chromosomal replication initiation ATPase DnaA